MFQIIFAFLIIPLFGINALAKQQKGATGFYYVNSSEGIPVYSSLNSDENSICGWLPGGINLETTETNSYFLEVVNHNSQIANDCLIKSYIQPGFLTESLYAGPTDKRLTQRWKATTPKFETQCVERHQGQKIIVSFVGDLLLHGALQRQAYSRNDGFRSLWNELDHVFQSADLAYANLEGPVAEGVTCSGRTNGDTSMRLGPKCGDSRSSVYTSYPMFNYHPRLVGDLLDSGINMVSTVNNHSLDRYSVGADKTIEALNREGLAFTGTRKSGSQKAFYTITKTYAHRGELFKIAWVGCTFSANGFRDKNNQLLNCYNYTKKGHPNFSSINPLVIETVRSLKMNGHVDGIIVTPHWGPTEYVHTVHTSQLSLGKQLIEAGATAVIGAHPHVLQPWEVIKTNDGRQGFIHYSLGNFVSNQKQVARRASMILLLGFQKTKSGLAIDGVRYIPTYFDSWNTGTRQLLPLNSSQKMFNAGSDSLSNIHSLFPSNLSLESFENLTTCQ